MTGVIYARYSSDNQKEESIEGQLRENRAYAEKNGITIIETYIDRAFSAKTDERPEFLRMIKESARKRYDVVIVWKLDRFARNRRDSAKYKSILKENNIKVVSATESISESADGIILEAVLEGIAEYYSADLAEKVTRGMTENALKCKYNGGISVPFGYLIDKEQHYQLDPVNAPIALEIFTRYAAGEPTNDIINDLNARGLLTSRQKPFNKNSFRKMIHNRNYIGEYHFSDVIIPNGVPAIVPNVLFNRALERMESNKRAPARHKAREKYLLTTKLFCGECQAMMVGESGQKKNGIYRYYKCAAAKRHECKLKPIRKELIEDFVVKKAMECISDTHTMDRIVKQIMALLNKENNVIPALERQLKDVRKSIANIITAIENGMLTRSTKERLMELEAQEDKLTEGIEREKSSQPEITEEMVRFILDKYTKLDTSKPSDRETIVEGLVGSVIIFGDGRVIITFNYRGEPVESTIDEIIATANSGSDLDCSAPPAKKQVERLAFFNEVAPAGLMKE